jgi:enoyl-CoA hydratase/carnithine racemase
MLVNEMSSTVTLEMEASVATLRIDDVSRANALAEDTARGLIAGFERAAADGGQCVILTGSGRFFCAGGDLNVIREWSDWEPLERREYLERGPHAIGRALRASGMASVAAVNGAASGAGMDLALLCDVRVASPEARFCEAYINIGVVPGDGGAWLLPRMIGLGRAMDLLLSGRTLPAQEALDWGIVTELVEGEQLLPRAREIAERLASRPPVARRLTREIVLEAGGQTWEEHLHHISLLMASVAGSAEHREALKPVLARIMEGRP